MDIGGSVVVVTGAARGIGEATVSAFQQRGALVAGGDVDEGVLAESAARSGLSMHGRLDVTDAQSFAEFLSAVERRVGPVSVLVNNAGIMPIGRLIDEDARTTERILDINLLGVITGTKLAIRSMQPRRTGHVLNVASMAAETYAPGIATYCASKFGVLGFTDAIRSELRGSGLHFTTVLPSFVNTDLSAGTPGMKGVKTAEPSDIAAAILAAVERPRRRVYVPKAAGAMIRASGVLPQRWMEAFTRRVGGDQFASNIDVEGRAAYERRARADENLK